MVDWHETEDEENDEETHQFLDELADSQKFVEDLYLDSMHQSNEEYLDKMKRYNSRLTCQAIIMLIAVIALIVVYVLTR